MEKTNLLTLQGAQEDLEQSVRYEYSQYYSIGLGTILLIIIYFYLSSLDKTILRLSFDNSFLIFSTLSICLGMIMVKILL